jgi:hypothetical protein
MFDEKVKQRNQNEAGRNSFVFLLALLFDPED